MTWQALPWRHATLDNCIRDQAVTNARQLNLLAADRCRR
jgi:hypothetical protein